MPELGLTEVAAWALIAAGLAYAAANWLGVRNPAGATVAAALAALIVKATLLDIG